MGSRDVPRGRGLVITHLFWRRHPTFIHELYDGFQCHKQRGRPKKNGELSEIDHWGLSDATGLRVHRGDEG